MKIVGHRGAKGLTSENTLASIEHAIACGVDAVEFDVHLTRDGIAVLHHDPAVVVANAQDMSIHDHTQQELVAVKPDLCSLEAALRTIDRRVEAMIEIKAPEAVPATMQVVRDLLAEGWTEQQFCFLSFTYPILRDVRSALPTVPIMVNEEWSGVRATWRARRLGTRRIDLNQRWLWGGFIRGMRRRGYELYSYTVNNPAQAARFEANGICGIVTDFPDRISASAAHREV